MPLFEKVLPETTRYVAGAPPVFPILPVECVCTSSARWGELLLKVLPLMVPWVRTELSDISSRNELAPNVSFRLLKVLFVTVSESSVLDAAFRMWTLLWALPLMSLLLIVAVPLTPTTRFDGCPSRRPSSDVLLPLLVTLLRFSVKFVTAVPAMPLFP